MVTVSSPLVGSSQLLRALFLPACLGGFEGEAGKVRLLGLFCSPGALSRRKDTVGVDLVIEASHEGAAGRFGVPTGVDAGMQDMRCQPGSHRPLVRGQCHTNPQPIRTGAMGPMIGPNPLSPLSSGAHLTLLRNPDPVTPRSSGCHLAVISLPVLILCLAAFHDVSVVPGINKPSSIEGRSPPAGGPAKITSTSRRHCRRGCDASRSALWSGTPGR